MIVANGLGVTTRNTLSKYGVEDLNSFAGRLTVWKCGSSQNPPLAVRREFQRGLVEAPTLTDNEFGC